MYTNTVEKVKEMNKGNKKMWLVTLEGENFMVFDAKWRDSEGCLVKYDKIKKGEYTNLELIEIIGKSEGKVTESTGFVAGGIRRNDYKYKALDCVNIASSAFIKSGFIKTPDEWIAFITQALPTVEDFLEEGLKPKTFPTEN